MVDISRATAGVDISPAAANEIWASAQESSAVMRLATPIDLPGNGISVPIITGDAKASYVAEGAPKPVSNATLGNKQITPYKIAVMQLFTDEYRRDQAKMANELIRRLPNALAEEFDRRVFHDVSPGSGHDVLSDVAELPLASADAWNDLLDVDAAIAEAGGELTGWALAPKSRSVLLRSTDASGRPLFINNVQTEGTIGSLLDVPATFSRSVSEGDTSGEVLGFAGDWRNAYYGTVDNISASVSGEASVEFGGTVYHLFQRNMFAVRVEVEVGFAVKNKAHFRKIVTSA